MSSESEKVTRKKRIDQLLNASGWIIIPYHAGIDLSGLKAHAIEEFPTANGPAD